jgi:arabinogalactan oligomer/maltooligosaccharide transport system permease protein
MGENRTAKPAREPKSARDWVAIVWAVLVLGIALLGLALGTYLLAARGSGLTGPRTVGLVVVWVVGVILLVRYGKVLIGVMLRDELWQARQAIKFDLIHLFLITVLLIVIFPLLWIFSMSLDPRDYSRPTGLTIIPPGASLDAYVKVLTQPSPNPVSFLQLLRNSLLVAGGTAVLAVAVGTSAAYAFSRLEFPGRRAGMLGFVLVLMIPAGATLAPLFVLLNSIRLRTTLWGLAIAYTSSALPFAIWNMKGFIDSLPYDLEEAAQIDGCTRAQGFVRIIVPLAVPGMAVTALTSFLTGWSEFILAWTFLTEPSRFTLPMVLRGMTGQYASGTPWSEFAAMSILMSIPAVALFFVLQKYLVSGLAAGGVKG